MPNSRDSKLSKAKVLFILLSPLPSPTAAWARIGFFAKFLKDRDINVAMVGAFSAKTISQAGSEDWNGIKIHNLIPLIMSTSIIAQILSIIFSSIMSIFLFLTIRPAVVIISVPSSGIPMGCYMIASLFKCRIITDYRDQWEDYNHGLTKSKISKWFLNSVKNTMTRCYEMSSIVITPTEPFAESLRNRGIEKVQVLPNGADISTFRPKDRMLTRTKLGISNGDFVIIFSGHVGRYYRLDTVVLALKKAKDTYGSDIKLLIAGRGNELQAILKLAKDVGLDGKVMYIGKILDKEELVDALCASDIGIIPYDSNQLWKNSIPVKSLEYLACGLPIIATAYKDSLIGRMINENELGLVAQPEDITSLSDAIYKLKMDLVFRSSAHTRALTFIERNYDRNKLATQLHSHVLTFLKDGRSESID